MSTSFFTVTCAGCNKQETHSPTVGLEYEIVLQEMKSRGWQRRAFWKPNWDLGPWFCCHTCAYESYFAKHAEEHWQKAYDEEFKECSKKSTRNIIFLPLVLISSILIIIGLIEVIFNVKF